MPLTHTMFKGQIYLVYFSVSMTEGAMATHLGTLTWKIP